jgi:hypothetical protein
MVDGARSTGGIYRAIHGRRSLGPFTIQLPGNDSPNGTEPTRAIPAEAQDPRVTTLVGAGGTLRPKGRAIVLANILAVPVLSQSSGRPNSLARSVSAPRDPAERVGAGSCTQIGDPDFAGASRILGPG